MSMTGMELRQVNGMPPTKADQMKRESMVVDTFRALLGAKVEDTLESGEVILITPMEKIAQSKVAFWMDPKNAGKFSIDEVQKAAGEFKQESTVTVQTASDVFRGLVVDDDDD